MQENEIKGKHTALEEVKSLFTDHKIVKWNLAKKLLELHVSLGKLQDIRTIWKIYLDSGQMN